ncbi:hypothetical protein B566_EDAN011003 [Ephemera danica]|nr:hypothetical protein B566_EDAN011003 [Ephemera danica]
MITTRPDKILETTPAFVYVKRIIGGSSRALPPQFSVYSSARTFKLSVCLPNHQDRAYKKRVQVQHGGSQVEAIVLGIADDKEVLEKIARKEEEARVQRQKTHQPQPGTSRPQTTSVFQAKKPGNVRALWEKGEAIKALKNAGNVTDTQTLKDAPANQTQTSNDAEEANQCPALDMPRKTLEIKSSCARAVSTYIVLKMR